MGNRRVKKVDGFYTLETKDRAGETDLLCDSCGNTECSIRMILQKVKINRFNAKLAVIKCQAYIPALSFRDTAGMASEFNTFRLGGAWAKRVEQGDLVNLVDGAGQLIGVAEVQETAVGPFPEMNAMFGADNHLAIDAEVNGRDFDMEKVMRECYGGHRFSPASTVSVISLRRVDGVGQEGT